MTRSPILAVLLVSIASLGASLPKRLKQEYLDAVRQSRYEYSRKRIVYPQIGIYHDYRAIVYVHPEDAPQTQAAREQVLTAARQDGVDIVFWAARGDPKPDAWKGVHTNVLFIPGSRDDGQLRIPGAGGEALQFLTQIDPAPVKSAAGYTGMEIYNRSTDTTVQKEFADWLDGTANKRDKTWKKLASIFRQYPDEVLGAATGPQPGLLGFYDRQIETRRFTAIAANDSHRNQVGGGVVLDTYEVAFRNVSTHILARALKEEDVRESLRNGHAYVAHDWICDPSGFSFVAINNLGVFDMGDPVPLVNGTRLVARFPLPAHIKLIHQGAVVSDTNSAELNFAPKEPGAYRLEAWLDAGGEERPWIYSNPLYLHAPEPGELALPPSTLAPGVKLMKDIPYIEGAPEDAGKHKLDLYLPAGKTKFPVLFFVHGGSWRSGDRALYASVGNRFAKLGIGVVIPSYRLAPKNPPPAQIDDVASAFAWTVRYIEKYGGDAAHIYVAGHSAGGHLVSLLALDSRYLVKHGLNAKSIKGVMTLSGVYDVRQVAIFGPDEQTRRIESPIEYVNRGAPPFLITYCQWDYPGLPAQAREFDRALRHNFVASTLRYIPGQNHISEMLHLWRDDDPTARAMLRFMGLGDSGRTAP